MKYGFLNRSRIIIFFFFQQIEGSGQLLESHIYIMLKYWKKITVFLSPGLHKHYVSLLVLVAVLSWAKFLLKINI